MRKSTKLVSIILSAVLFASVPMNHVVDAEDNAKTAAKNDITVTETVDELAQETILDDKEDLESDSLYTTKRLIVVSDESAFETHEADFVISYGNMYILSYDTEKQCKKAYKKLKKDETILSVDIDAVMETEENTGTAEKVVDIDSSAELGAANVSGTEENVLKTHLNSLEAVAEVKVAILDTGIDTSMELFADRIIDLGLNLSSSGEENSIEDDNGHGTEMATIICDNSNENVKLMPIKIANADGKATVLNTYLGIKYAMENDADVINLSMNTVKSATSQILTDIIDEATEQGITVVVSAGNNSMDTVDVTPANVDSAVVIGAVNNDNAFAEYSNYGETVDYVSYGTYEDAEEVKNGTSYATATVTGIIADLLSKQGSVDTLKSYAVDLGDSGYDIYYGNGLISLIDKAVSSNNNSSSDYISQYVTSESRLDEKTILELDWKNISNETLDDYLENTDYEYIGLLLSNLTEEERKLIKNKSEILNSDILVSILKMDDVESGDAYSFSVDGEYEINFADYCIKEYEKVSDILGTSEWSIRQATGYFYISSDTRKSVYRYAVKGFNHAYFMSNTDFILGQDPDAVFPWKDKTLTVTRTAIANDDAAFNPPEFDSITYYLVNARAHRTVFVSNDGETSKTIENYEYIKLGNDDGILSYGFSIKLKGFEQKKTGYHTTYNDVDVYKWDKDDTKENNMSSTEAAGIYKFNDAGDTRNNTPYANQKVADKELVKGTLTYCYNGVYKSGKSYDNGDRQHSALKSCSGDKTQKNIYRPYGFHTIDESSSTFELNYNYYESLGLTTYSQIAINNPAVKAVRYADRPNYVLRLVPNEYYVCYWDGVSGVEGVGDESITGEMTFSLHTYDTSKKLNENKFKRSYDITLDVNGGDALTQTEYTSNYEFDGWATSYTGTALYGDQALVKNLTTKDIGNDGADATVNLYAKWKGGEVTLPIPTRTGYTFLGWYDASDAKIGDDEGNYTPTANITLTAKWKIHQSTLTIDPNGGKWNNITAKKDLKENYGTQKDIPDPTIDNYTVTFDGNGGIPEKTSETTQVKFIKWNEVFGNEADIGTAGKFFLLTKKFTYGEEDGGTGTMTAKWNGEYKVTTSGATRIGYELLGWNEDEDATVATYEKDKQIEVTKNITYYAIWEEIEYDIVYDMNGGTGTPITDTKTYFMDYTVKSDTECGYTRDGYTFIGWAVNPDATDPLAENFQLPEEYQPGQLLDETIINDNNENIHDRKLTLYAVWMPLIKIAYMMNNTATTAEANSEYTMSGQNIIVDGENGIGIPMDEGCTIYDNMAEAVQAYALEASEETEENFKMEGVYTYQDNNGNSYTENVTSTVVGWAFYSDTNADSCDYALAEEVGRAETIYNDGSVLGEGSITTGTPRVEFYENADGQVDPAVPQPENDNTIYANLFAVYDYGPKVHAVPLYYTLYNAQTGYITLDDLLSHVEVFDTEDSNIVAVDTIPAKEDRAEDTTYYTVIDYQPSDFTQLTGDAMVSETYYAVDSAGNVTKKRINVEIVDVDASIQDADPKDGESRFISYKYLWTLKKTSIWLTEPYFSQLVSAMHYEEVEPEIKAAYPHIYNERTESLALQMIDVDMTPPIPIFGDMFKHEIRGTRQYDRPPKQVWIFKHEDVLAVKQFVEENGFTTYADKEELDAFLEKFDYCYKYDNGVFRHEGTQEECDFYQRWFSKLGL